MDTLLVHSLQQHLLPCTSRGLFITRADGTPIDICTVIDDSPGTGVVFLCSSLFPVSKEGFTSLFKALNSGATKCGFSINVIRTRDKGTSHQIACSRFRMFQKITEKNKDTFSHTRAICIQAFNKTSSSLRY